MSLDQEIAAWDGKSADDIAAVYSRHHGQPAFVDSLVEFSKEPAYQKGATWLLKRWFESGNSLDSQQITTVYSSLQALEDWESRLHLLQCIPHMPIEKPMKPKVEFFLRASLTDSNKFVRAWAYNGFYELALQYPEYVDEVQAIFDLALRDEAASVKARIRNIQKKGW